jgi:hypothetical protein
MSMLRARFTGGDLAAATCVIKKRMNAAAVVLAAVCAELSTSVPAAVLSPPVVLCGLAFG